MYIKSFVVAVGLVALTGCAGNVAIPALSLDHPANPKAVAAPLPPPPTVPEATKVVTGTQGMKEMQGMDHGSMGGMHHDSMKGIGQGSMQDMKGMEGMYHGH